MARTRQRQELIWRATQEEISLAHIWQEFHQFLRASDNSSTLEPSLNHLDLSGRLGSRTILHRCPGYTLNEIILTTDIRRSIVVVHDSPTPHEICYICKKVVEPEWLNCECGNNSKWLHNEFSCMKVYH